MHQSGQSQVDARSLKPMHVRAFSKDNIFCEYSPDYSTFTIVLIVMYFESKTESKYCYSNYLFSQCMFTCFQHATGSTPNGSSHVSNSVAIAPLFVRLALA